MPEGFHIPSGTAYAILATCLLANACDDSVTDMPPPGQEVRLRVEAIVSSTTASVLVVEVTAPDIDPPLTFNIDVVDGVASGTVSVPAGSDRTFTLRAYDVDGIETHRASTTVAIHEGTNPAISLTLIPLTGDQPISVAIGTIVITITPPADTVAIGHTVQLTATVTDSDSNPVPGSVHWAVLDASKATIDSVGVITGLDTGTVDVVAVFGHIAASAEIEVMVFSDLVEGLVSRAFQSWWSGTQDANPAMALSQAADEYSMSWANFAGQQLSSEPRVAWPNEPTFNYAAFTEAPWDKMYETLAAINEGWKGLDEMGAGGDPGGIVPRARAFAKLVQGMCHGWLALMFDQAFILDETVDLDNDVLVLQPYTDVWAAAKTQFEEAIAIADTSAFTLPSAWINGNPLTSAQLSQFAHSQLARWLPQMARTPAQRDAVDWTEVIGHVDQGIQSDFIVAGDANWEWFFAMYYFGQQTTSTTWARADYKTIGPTDTSGSFTAWLAAPVQDRNEFLMETADRRITADGDPTGAGTDFMYGGPSQFPAARGTYHYSFYEGSRYEEYANGNQSAPITYMSVVEMQLTKAEGLLRTTGPSVEVVGIINSTRVTRGQLPPAAVVESEAALMDKLIYEKRIEEYGYCSGCAFFDRRGWGPPAPTGPDFHLGPVEGTPSHFPVPGRVLEQLGIPIYTFGGVGNEMGAGIPAPVAPKGVRVADIYRVRVVPGARRWSELQRR